jgi:P4 family phage/plasmid primase-like protien
MNLTAFARQMNIYPANNINAEAAVIIPPLTGTYRSGAAPAALYPADGRPQDVKPKSRKNIIREGERNNTLSRKAGQLLKRYGDTDETRRRYNEVCALCEPRLDVKEENRIYLSAQQFFHNVITKSPTYKHADLYGTPPFAIPTDRGFTISPPLLADYYLERHTVIIEINSGNPRIYEYDGGVYVYRTDLEVKAVLGEYIKAFRRSLWQSRTVAEAYMSIIHTAALYVTQDKLNANPDVVCMKNGLLNIKEWRLYPHNPDVYYTTQLDCDFTEAIPATPLYDKTLYDYCEGSEAKQRFILQYQGAIFSNVHGYKFKRFLLTIGEKDSGKTILKRLTEILVGDGNYNNCDLADLENNRFAAASLYLKKLSGTNDLRSAKIPEVGRLLQLTGGDSMRVERKNEQDFSMIYTGYIWHVGNKKPIYGGKQNDALYLRQILFELNHTIPQEKQDHHLIEKLLTERQGIILKCLYAARKAIYDNDYRFDVPAECERSKAEHRHSNNIISQFLEECAEPLDIKTLTKLTAEKHTAAKVWQAFKSWRDYCGEYKGTTRNDFEEELADIFDMDVKDIKVNQHSGSVVGRFYPVRLSQEGLKYNNDNFPDIEPPSWGR